MVGVHDLGDNRQSSLPLRFQQQFDAIRLQSLEIIGRGPGFEGSTPEHGGPSGLDAFSHGNDLLLALHRARAGDHNKVALPHLDVLLAYLDNGVQGMEFPVGAFEGFRHTLDSLYNIQPTDQALV